MHARIYTPPEVHRVMYNTPINVNRRYKSALSREILLKYLCLQRV